VSRADLTPGGGFHPAKEKEFDIVGWVLLHLLQHQTSYHIDRFFIRRSGFEIRDPVILHFGPCLFSVFFSSDLNLAFCVIGEGSEKGTAL
jgi:hypothetical protein